MTTTAAASSRSTSSTSCSASEPPRRAGHLPSAKLQPLRNASRRIATHTCTKVRREAAASVVQVCELGSAGSDRGHGRVGEGRRHAAGRNARNRSRRGGPGFCTHVATASGHFGPPELLSPEQVARICGLSRRAVYRAIARGDLAAGRLCNRLRVRPEDLDRWITESVERRSVPQPDVLPRTAPRPRGSLRSMLGDVSANGSSGR
jgi:excisionase family DNA binding protein